LLWSPHGEVFAIFRPMNSAKRFAAHFYLPWVEKNSYPSLFADKYERSPVRGLFALRLSQVLSRTRRRSARVLRLCRADSNCRPNRRQLADNSRPHQWKACRSTLRPIRGRFRHSIRLWYRHRRRIDPVRAGPGKSFECNGDFSTIDVRSFSKSASCSLLPTFRFTALH
jgi:hypothetical protein